MNSSRVHRYNIIYRKIADGSLRQRHHNHDNDAMESTNENHINNENHIAVKALRLNKQIAKNKGILRFFNDSSNYPHNNGQHNRNITNSGKKAHSQVNSSNTSGSSSSAVQFSKPDAKATVTLTKENSADKWTVPLSTKSVMLKANGLEASDVIVLCENLENLWNLSGLTCLSLDLSDNPINDCSFLQILSVIEGYASLETLQIDLKNGEITDASLRCSQVALARITRLRSLQLNLSGTKVTEKQIGLWIERVQKPTIDLRVVSDFQERNIENANNSSNNNTNNYQQNPGMVNSGSQQQYPAGALGGINNSLNNSNNQIGLTSVNNPYSIGGNSNNNSNMGVLSNNNLYGSQQSFSNQLNNNNNTSNNYINNGWNNPNSNNNNNLNNNTMNNLSASSSASTTATSSNTIQEEDVKRKSPEELAAEKNLEDGYGKGFKILMGLGYKVGKGLGKNDQGITEPVQATNKSKFKENNQRMATVDYFETLTGKAAALQGSSQTPASSTPTHGSGNNTSTGPTKMIKFEKKATLVVNNNQLLQEEEGEVENTSPSVPAREPGEIASSSASANTKKQPSPFTAFNNPFYGTPHYINPALPPTVTPFSGNNQAGTQQQPFRHQRIM